MKKGKNILIVSEFTNTSTLIDHPDWRITVARPGEDAIEVVQRQSFDLIMIDMNAGQALTRKMKAVMPLLSVEAEIHDFDTSDQLQYAISSAFDRQRDARLSRIVVSDIMTIEH